MGLAARAFEIAERAVAVVEDLAPEWALRRALSRQRRDMLASGYSRHGASRTKKSLVGFNATAGGPDSDITDNLETLRERSRDLCMGEGLAIGALRTIRTNEIGSGLRLNAQIDADFLGLSDEEADAWMDHVEREFALWADSNQCDAARRSTFGELQALARLSQLMSGDVFAILPAIERTGDRYDTKIQLVEADRVCDPWPAPKDADVLGGVEVGKYGEPVAFYFADAHPGDRSAGHLRVVGSQTWTRVPAFGATTGRPLVLHLMESERPGQRRGVPLLAPVIEKLKQLSRYSEAELMAAVVSGMFTVAITSQMPQAGLGQVLPPAGSGKPDAEIDTGNPEDRQLGNGAVVSLAPGENISTINPGRPNAGFDPFVKAILLQIGVGLDVPYHVLIKYFDGSYNASRAALLEFWKRVNVGRAWLVSGFCQPVYAAWLEEAVLRGYVNAPGFLTDPLIRAAWCGAEWIGPTQGQLDPVKEVEAAKMRVENGFSTRTAETIALTGQDWWAGNRLRGREEQARADAGLVGSKSLTLTPTANEAITKVNEGRAASGLPPEEGGDDETVLERTRRIEREAGPQPEEQAA